MTLKHHFTNPFLEISLRRSRQSANQHCPTLRATSLTLVTRPDDIQPCVSKIKAFFYALRPYQSANQKHLTLPGIGLPPDS